jgi:hypothetical protein
MKKGWMKKQGRKGLIKNWTKRYFVLDAGCIKYYERESASAPFGESLKGELNLTKASIEIDASKYGPNQVYVVSTGDNNMLMEADSAAEAKEWMAAIQLHIAFANGGTSPASVAAPAAASASSAAAAALAASGSTKSAGDAAALVANAQASAASALAAANAASSGSVKMPSTLSGSIKETAPVPAPSPVSAAAARAAERAEARAEKKNAVLAARPTPVKRGKNGEPINTAVLDQLGISQTVMMETQGTCPSFLFGATIVRFIVRF